MAGVEQKVFIMKLLLWVAVDLVLILAYMVVLYWIEKGLAALSRPYINPDKWRLWFEIVVCVSFLNSGVIDLGGWKAWLIATITLGVLVHSERPRTLFDRLRRC